MQNEQVILVMATTLAVVMLVVAIVYVLKGDKR